MGDSSSAVLESPLPTGGGSSLKVVEVARVFYLKNSFGFPFTTMDGATLNKLVDLEESMEK